MKALNEKINVDELAHELLTNEINNQIDTIELLPSTPSFYAMIHKGKFYYHIGGTIPLALFRQRWVQISTMILGAIFLVILLIPDISNRLPMILKFIGNP